MIGLLSNTVVFIHGLYNIYSNLRSYKQYFFLDNFTGHYARSMAVEILFFVRHINVSFARVKYLYGVHACAPLKCVSIVKLRKFGNTLMMYIDCSLIALLYLSTIYSPHIRYLQYNFFLRALHVKGSSSFDTFSKWRKKYCIFLYREICNF